MKILHIESSIFAHNGQSSQLSRRLIAQLKSQQPAVEVVEKHFAAAPVPHFDADFLTALNTKQEQRTEKQQQMVDFADQQIEDLESADILLIGLPMYNFGVPSMLKSWFDFVARAGVTFRYTENGPEGLVKNKKAIIVATRGGLYKGTPADSQTTFVSTFLNFIGIEDIEWVYAEGLNMGEETKQLAFSGAEQELLKIAAAVQ
ncbi:MAG: NAD(P)H-dependent oxidoreductase [Gammaproteobacteria bacterium]|nr:NAD(P)H-dependent oxidoreductase [Gammaproteobacteria bacterium]